MKHSAIPRAGITGGIGSGKSIVCRVFENVFGIPVFYADAVAKSLVQTDPALRKGIIAVFGEAAYEASGDYNRAHVGRIAFSDPEKLAALNALVHPAVETAAIAWHAEQAARGVPYTLKEAALMVESGSYRHLDFLIAVAAPEALRIERVMARDGVAEEQVRARMRGQMPEAEKLSYADFIIHNDGQQLLLPQIREAHRRIMALK